MLWIWFAVAVAIVVFLRLLVSYLKMFTRLSAAEAELGAWRRVTLRVYVGRLGLVVTDLDHLRTEGLNQALAEKRVEEIMRHADEPGAVLPAVVVRRQVVITEGGEAWMPLGGASSHGPLIPVVVAAEGIPLPPSAELPRYDAILATWWPASIYEHDSTRESDSND